jgi:hypothetical protein
MTGFVATFLHPNRKWSYTEEMVMSTWLERIETLSVIVEDAINHALIAG